MQSQELVIKLRVPKCRVVRCRDPKKLQKEDIETLVDGVVSLGVLWLGWKLWAYRLKR